MDEREWMSSDNPAAMLEVLRQRGIGSERKLRLFACACWQARCYMMINSVQSEFGKDLPHIERIEKLIDGSPEDLQSLCKQVVLEAEFTGTIWCAAPDAYLAAFRWANCRGSMETGLTAKMSVLLRDIFGNPFQPVDLDAIIANSPVGPGKITDWTERGFPQVNHVAVAWLETARDVWLTENALAIAKTIYEENRWEDLPILSDALEEAGCQYDEILEHCHNKRRVWDHALSGWRITNLDGEHVRGCWVLDLILGHK